jgi:hypothetical protein
MIVASTARAHSAVRDLLHAADDEAAHEPEDDDADELRADVEAFSVDQFEQCRGGHRRTFLACETSNTGPAPTRFGPLRA